MTTEQDNNDACGAHVCPHKMAFMLDNWFRRLLQPPGKILGEYVKEGDTAIDLGCGPGFFSLEMARRVGPGGKVIAVDLQPEMLAHVKKKAAAKDLAGRMVFHQCTSTGLGLELENKAGFILAFYMIHETPDPAAFLKQVRPLLKKGGKFLAVEPKMHVTTAMFEEMAASAEAAGFRILEFPKKKGGRSVLFTI